MSLVADWTTCWTNEEKALLVASVSIECQPIIEGSTTYVEAQLDAM